MPPTAITMRADALHLALLHGYALVMDLAESNNMAAMRCEAETLLLHARISCGR